LRNTDLDARRRVVQKLDVVRSTIRKAQFYVDMGPRKDVPIPFADSLVGLILRACCDCKFRRRCRNEIIQRQPAHADNTQERSQSLSQPPATESQHDAPRQSLSAQIRGCATPLRWNS